MVTPVSNREEWTEAVHKEQGFVLHYTAEWRQLEGIGTRPMVLVGPENRLPAMVQASAPPLSDVSCTDLDGYLARRLEALGRVLTDLRLLDDSVDQLGDTTGRRLLFSYRHGIYLLNLVDWTALGRDRALSVSGVCVATDYARTESVFQAMASSTCFTESSRSITR